MLLNKIKSLLPFLFAGAAFSLSAQCVEMIDLRRTSLVHIFDSYLDRIIISALVGAVLFVAFYFLTKRIKNVRICTSIEFGLKLFNFFWLYLLMAAHGSNAFLYITGIVLIGFILKLSYPTQLDIKPSAVQIRNILLSLLALAYFPATVIIADQQWTFFDFSKLVLAFSVFSLPIVLFPNKWTKTLLILSLIALACLAIPHVFHFYMFGTIMPKSAYYVVFESPIQEQIEYVSTYLTWHLSGLIFLYVLPCLLCVYFIKSIHVKLFDSLIKHGGVFWLLVFSFCFISIVNRYDLYSAYINNNKDYQQEIKQFQVEFDKRQNRKINFTGLTENNPTNESQTFVLVIGEATDRNHMSLYGYNRPTSPLLGKMTDELLVFNDVISPHSHTMAVLRKVLTFATIKDLTPFYKEGTMIELFKQAGYRTYWLSNQYYLGDNAGLTASLANSADIKLFVNQDTVLFNESKSFDGRLLLPLEHVLHDDASKRFIIIHLMGAHGSYENRYPDDFNFFNESNVNTIRTKNKPFLASSDWGKFMITHYDNAVRYNDYVMSEILKLMKKNVKYGYLLYFSDHGEEVYDSRPTISHQETNPSTFMFEIPFVLWLSDDYKKANQDKVKDYPNYVNRPYQTDNVIHSIIDLSNLKLNRYNATKSIFSPDFKQEKRYMSGMDYDSVKVNYKVFVQVIKK